MREARRSVKDNICARARQQNMKAVQQQLIGVINVESHIVKFSILSGTDGGDVLTESSRPVDLIKPNPGRVEVDAENVWNALCTTIDEAIERLELKRLSKDHMRAIGIINERDTVLAWDSETNKPLCNAIHYSDTRTDAIIRNRKSKSPNVFDAVEGVTGLRVTSLFGATKLKWIIDNANDVKRLVSNGNIRFGTLDTWLVWKLTRGNLYVTDVTNASRTLLMNCKTFMWCPKACEIFNVPICLLPTIHSSCEPYGIIEETSLKGILIGSVFANHQAALYGLNYTKTGQATSSYGDSCTVSCIVGTEFIKSDNGLLTTVAYKIGNEPAVYAFEGQMSVGGKAIEWLRNNLKIKASDQDIETLDAESSDIYFVPAFNGLDAPHWKPDARGIICGMTLFTNRKHIIQAALEALCFHTKDVCIAFKKDMGIMPSQLIVHGTYSVYNNLLDYQADILGVDVKRSRMTDMGIYGSAKAAALALNIEFDNNYHELSPQHVSKPTTTKEERKRRYLRWLKAVKRSDGLSKETKEKSRKTDILSSTIIPIAYLMFMMGMMVVSDK